MSIDKLESQHRRTREGKKRSFLGSACKSAKRARDVPDEFIEDIYVCARRWWAIDQVSHKCAVNTTEYKA